MEQILLKVGEKAPEKWMERFRKMNQGGVLEWDKHTGELYLFIILHNIKAKEKRKIKQGLIRFRLYEKDDCILPIFVVDNPREDLLLELPFDPSLYEEEMKLTDSKLNIFMIEKKDETIQMMRTIDLGEEFTIKLFGNWVWKEKGFTADYQTFLKEAYQHKSIDLWEQATPVDWDK